VALKSEARDKMLWGSSGKFNDFCLQVGSRHPCGFEYDF